jgi:SNF2 family DNA or RNA helicase
MMFKQPKNQNVNSVSLINNLGDIWLDAMERNFFYRANQATLTRISRKFIPELNFTKNGFTFSNGTSQKKNKSIVFIFDSFSKNEKQKFNSLIFNNLYLYNSVVNNLFTNQLIEAFTDIKVNLIEGSKVKTDKPFTLVLNSSTELYLILLKFSKILNQNPFLILELRDYNALEIFTNINNEITEFSNNYKNRNIILFTDNLLENKPEYIEPVFNKKKWEELDFSVIQDIRLLIIGLYSDFPFFHIKNFKQIIDSIYKDIVLGVKFYDNNIGLLNVNHQIINELEEIKTISFEIDYHYNLIKIKCTLFSDEVNDIDFKYLLKLMTNINEKHLENYCLDLCSLYVVYTFCIRLLINGAFIPQILRVDENSFKLRWIPAITSNEISSLLDKITEMINPQLVTINKENIEYYQKPSEVVKTLCSMFFQHFIIKDSEMTRNFNQIIKDDNCFNFFFRNQILVINSQSGYNTLWAITKWLKSFTFINARYSPVFCIEEVQDGFSLKIFIKENNNLQNQKLIKYSDFFNSSEYSTYHNEILDIFNSISDQFSNTNTFDFQCNADLLKYSNDDFIHILTKVLPLIRLLGFEIQQPDSLKYLEKPQLTLFVDSANIPKNASIIKISEILKFKWQIAIGENIITIDEFQELTKGLKGIVKFRNNFVYISPNELEDLQNSIKKPPKVNQTDLLRFTITKEYHHAKIELHEKVKKLLEGFNEKENQKYPENLSAQLRPYQVRGFEWMAQNSKYGFGSLIADDMGLGKTLQVIALILKFKNEGKLDDKKALVIVPTTLLTNWLNEIEKFTTGLKAHVYHGAVRELETVDYDVIISTYRTVANDIELFVKKEWFLTVIDEAQNIKNPQTIQTKAIKRIVSEVKIAMSGTPVENRLSEYWSIFDFINTGYLGPQNSFEKDFVIPIQHLKNHAVLEVFRKMTQPFILRRLKSDKSIISDLPDKIINNQYCSLTVEQAAIYQNVIDQTMNEIETSDGMQRRGLILKLMTNLKQICNHPSHYSKSPIANPESSGKAMLLFSILENIFENNEKTLIFTQYKEMGDLLVSMITKQFQIPVMFLHGGLQRKDRDEMVKSFQEQKHKKVFVLSLKAGGTGLNLTAASNVIHYDLWWNPAVEQQATDRAHRIGQKNNVMVYRLLTQNTFETAIDKILTDKKDLADRTVISGEKWIGELDNKELRGLFKYQ